MVTISLVARFGQMAACVVAAQPKACIVAAQLKACIIHAVHTSQHRCGVTICSLLYSLQPFAVLHVTSLHPHYRPWDGSAVMISLFVLRTFLFYSK